MKKPNQTTIEIYCVLFLLLITAIFACTPKKSNSELLIAQNDTISYDSLINKILLEGRFSDDAIIRKNEIELFLVYLKASNEKNYNKNLLIVSSLENIKVNMTSSQKARFEKVKIFDRESFYTKSETFFNKDSLDDNMKSYLKAYNYPNYEGMNTEELATQCGKIYAKQINERFEKGIPVAKLLSANEINFLAGSNGFLAYSKYKISYIQDNGKRNELILRQKNYIEALKCTAAEIWQNKNVKVERSWFNPFNLKFESFLATEREKNTELDKLLKAK